MVTDTLKRMRILVAGSKIRIVCAALIFNFLFVVMARSQVHQRVDVGLFSRNDTSGWEIRDFEGASSYAVSRVDGKQVLVADSQQSASMYYKKIEVDLEVTPMLNWSWRKERTIDPGNELEKNGDDYVARIYLVIDGGLFKFRTTALNYVWSYRHVRQDVWNNPFAGKNVKMLSLRDASDPQGQWFNEKRNVVMDFKRLHGVDARKIDGVAIMTDSDNSGLSARALYGDIYFDAGME